MLKRIELRNFCGFSEFALDVDDFAMLIGPNNGGKTTILRAERIRAETTINESRQAEPGLLVGLALPVIQA